MAEIKLKTAEVVGSANPVAWSQVNIVHGQESQVLVLVSLWYKGESDLIDLAQIGTSWLEALSEKGEVGTADVEGLGKEIEAAVAVVRVKGSRIKVSGVGGADIFIKRGEKLGKIFGGGVKVSESEGGIEIGDRLMLTTRAVAERLGVNGVDKYLKEGVEGVESLAVLVHGQSNSGGTAVIIVEADTSREELEQQVVPQYKRVLAIGGYRDKLNSLLARLSLRKPLVIQEEKKRWNVIIGTVLLFALLLGVTGGMIKRSKLIKERALTQLTSSVEQKMQEAGSIADLNPERAKLLLSQGRAEIEQYQAETKEQKYKEKASTLEGKLTALETEVFRKQEVSLNTLMELSLVKKGISFEKMFLGDQGNLLLPETDSPIIDGINLGDKSTLTIDLGSLGKAKELSTYNKKVYGIVDGGIFLASGDEKKIVIEPDELWGEITLIDMFGGNVYLLDRGQSEIWKYPVLTDGFGTRRRWLGAGIRLDLSNVIDMKVDGDIWLLTSSGKLERYSRGVPVEFAMEGFPFAEGDKLVNPTALFVTENEVYVLESGANRVDVFEKESGKYERQYAAEDLKNGKDLVVEGDKAYVLLPDRIVWFQL